MELALNRFRDHPRMCGEHIPAALIQNGGEGSSPHVRGAPSGTVNGIGFNGIIPACAGSTNLSAGIHCRKRDHPRMCGEHT